MAILKPLTIGATSSIEQLEQNTKNTFINDENIILLNDESGTIPEEGSGLKTYIDDANEAQDVKITANTQDNQVEVDNGLGVKIWSQISDATPNNDNHYATKKYVDQQTISRSDIVDIAPTETPPTTKWTYDLSSTLFNNLWETGGKYEFILTETTTPLTKIIHLYPDTSTSIHTPSGDSATVTLNSAVNNLVIEKVANFTEPFPNIKKITETGIVVEEVSGQFQFTIADQTTPSTVDLSVLKLGVEYIITGNGETGEEVYCKNTFTSSVWIKRSTNTDDNNYDYDILNGTNISYSYKRMTTTLCRFTNSIFMTTRYATPADISTGVTEFIETSWIGTSIVLYTVGERIIIIKEV